MSLRPFKFLFLGTLGLSLLFGNSAAIAQVDNGDVVVPTTGNGGSTTIPTGGNGGDIGATISTSTGGFGCQFYKGQYTVMYQPKSQPGTVFPWAAPANLGGGWNAQKRCQTIAQRLESYRRDGLLELQTAVENRQNIVCVTTEANGFCRIVFTVPPEKDPYVVRNSVFENLMAADSGEETTAVNTYGNRRADNGVREIYKIGQSVFGGKKPVSNAKAPIKLKNFLDKADGGTGQNLRNGISLRSNNPKTKPATTPNKKPTRLNPGNFR